MSPEDELRRLRAENAGFRAQHLTYVRALGSMLLAAETSTSMFDRLVKSIGPALASEPAMNEEFCACCDEWGALLKTISESYAGATNSKRTGH